MKRYSTRMVSGYTSNGPSGIFFEPPRLLRARTAPAHVECQLAVKDDDAQEPFGGATPCCCEQNRLGKRFIHKRHDERSPRPPR